MLVSSTESYMWALCEPLLMYFRLFSREFTHHHSIPVSPVRFPGWEPTFPCL
jgi:hypothetical protein